LLAIGMPVQKAFITNRCQRNAAVEA